MSQCQQAQQQKYPSFQNQISDRSYKIRTQKVINEKKEIIKKKKTHQKTKLSRLLSADRTLNKRARLHTQEQLKEEPGEHLIQLCLTSETDGKISRTLHRGTSGPRKAVLGLLLETTDKNSPFCIGLPCHQQILFVKGHIIIIFSFASHACHIIVLAFFCNP